MAYVVVKSAKGEIDRRELSGPVIIGRELDADIWIADRRMSRLHCRVEPEGEQWVLVDLNSRNGTFVDGQKIERQVLTDGQSFAVGDHRVTFHTGKLVPRRAATPMEPKMPELARAAEAVEHTLDESMLGATHAEAGTVEHGAGGAGRRVPPLPFQRPQAQPKVEVIPARVDRRGQKLLWRTITILAAVVVMALFCWYIFRR